MGDSFEFLRGPYSASWEVTDKFPHYTHEFHWQPQAPENQPCRLTLKQKIAGC